MKTPCPALQTLARFLNEELSAPLSNDVARHLESCSTCQAHCETLTQAFDTPAAEVASSGASDVLDNLMSRLIHSHGSVTGANAGHANPRMEFSGPPDDRAPLGRLGHYAIQELIAEGAQGVLYRGHDETLNRTVAIKLVHQRLTQSPAALARFRREARLIAAVQSDHVVRVFQVGCEPGFPPFLVMEFVAGESLRDRLDRHATISFLEAVQIVRDTAAGLQAAHQQGLIHRDVKPSNILLDQVTERARLTDFGLAVEETDTIRMTLEGTILGTPAYMSPEQVTCPESTDARSDLYSLAVVFYELLTGEVPFRGTVRMTILQVVHEEPRSPRQYNDSIPKDLETICLKAMSKDPASRFQQASDFMDELDRWSSSREILSRPISSVERFWRWCRRNPVVSALCATVLILLLTLSAVMTWSSMRLAATNELSRQSAIVAQEQSSAALDTLSKLIFELQDHFDQDETDLDELQKETLQIALAGLRKIRLSADSQKLPEIATAAALRRLGDLLSRLDQEDEAISCLEQAESILRGQLKTNANNPEAIKTLVEVLWSRDDLAVNSPDGNVSLVDEAVSFARRRRELSSTPDATFMLATGLMRQGSTELDSGAGSSASRSLQESMTLSNSLTTPESDYSSAARQTWLIAADLCYVAMLTDDNAAALKHLQTAIQRADDFVTANPHDIEFNVHLVGLHERLVSYWENSDNAAALESATQSFNKHLHNLQLAAQSDSDTFFIVSQSFSEFIEDRIAEDNPDSAERLLTAMISIAISRLTIASDDTNARGDLAICWSDLGDLKSRFDDPPTAVLDCYQKSITEFRTLSTTEWFDESDWIDYLSTLLNAATFAKDTGLDASKTLHKDATDVLQSIRTNHPNFAKDWQLEIEQQLDELTP